MSISNKNRKTGIKIKPLHLDFSDAREIYFPAIITEFNNRIQPNWNEEEVYGRMDPIGTYKNTVRKLTFAFRVISNNVVEGQTNMGYLSNLLQYQYPRFNQYNNKEELNVPSVLQSPPFFEIRFMNIIMSGLTPNTGLRGYFTNFQHNTTFGQQNNSQIFDNTNDRLYFSDFTISCEFTVLHEKPIGWYSNVSQNDISGFNYPYGVIPSGENNKDIIDAIVDETKIINTVLFGPEENTTEFDNQVTDKYYQTKVFGQ